MNDQNMKITFTMKETVCCKKFSPQVLLEIEDSFSLAQIFKGTTE